MFSTRVDTYFDIFYTSNILLKNKEYTLRFSEVVAKKLVLHETLVQTCYRLCSFYNIHTFFSLKHILILYKVYKTEKDKSIKIILFIPHNIKIQIIYKCLGLCEIKLFIQLYFFYKKNELTQNCVCYYIVYLIYQIKIEG